MRQSSVVLAPVAAQLMTALHQVGALHTGETGMRRRGRLAWAHVASTRRMTRHAVHPKRGAEATDATGIPPDFIG